MGIVTSFIPGRIRLRSRIFRDDDIASAFTSLLDATGIVTGIERNANTGSFLVSYRAECIPSAENLIRFASRFHLYASVGQAEVPHTLLHPTGQGCNSFCYFAGISSASRNKETPPLEYLIFISGRSTFIGV